MNNIYKRISARTGGKFDALRFASVQITSGAANVRVVCKKSDRRFVEDNRAELVRILKDECAFNAELQIAVCDDPPTPAAVRAAVVAFTQGFSYVSSVLHTVSVECGEAITVHIKMHETMYGIAKTDYLPRLNELLENSYACPVRVDIAVVEFADSGTEAAQSMQREYDLGNLQPVIGALKPTHAQSVTCISGGMPSGVVCGRYAMPTEFVSKGGKRYDRFIVNDGDVSLHCRFFPNGGVGLVRSDLMGKTVVVSGGIEYDAERGEASMLVRELSVCSIDGFRAPSPKSAPERYERVFPEKYEEYVQAGIFDGQSDIPPSLRGGFVVFDFETTGLSPLNDTPTELGAVKIKDGKIVEIFSTLIDPRRPIPTVVSEKTGITDEMVKGQPLFEDVIADFYKFSYGCALVGHNIAFDFPFLVKGGNRCGFDFTDRKTFDTMGLAPLAFPGIQRLSLDAVLEQLELKNENAHRAWADSAMTAKAFIAMQKIVYGRGK